MKQKNFVVECLIGAENRVTFIVRELPNVPNAPAQPVCVCESSEELAQFFDAVTLEVK